MGSVSAADLAGLFGADGAADQLDGRRAATLTSLLILPIGVVLVSVAITSLSGVGVYIYSAYSMFILLHPDAGAVVIITERIRNTLSLFAGLLALAWVFAYGWQRYREAR